VSAGINPQPYSSVTSTPKGTRRELTAPHPVQFVPQPSMTPIQDWLKESIVRVSAYACVSQGAHAHMPVIMRMKTQISILFRIQPPSQPGVEIFDSLPFWSCSFRFQYLSIAYELTQVYNLWHKMKRVYGTHQIEEAIRLYLRKKDWALLDCRINYFDAYQTLYDSKQAEKVTQMLEQLISEVVEDIGRPEDVLGFESADHFMMITSETAAPKIKELLKSRFNSEILAHYSNLNRERGYMLSSDHEKIPFMHLSVGIVIPSEHTGRWK
jgi:hypothetical protein